ncbi:MAG: N-acetylmuramoyl-L-alanine amidase [Christensenellales bacterium]|jgi:hypothetical protein
MFGFVKDLGLKPVRAYKKRAKTDAIVLHHFASHATTEQVHAQHIKKGNRGIDYNIVIMLDGTAVWGRGIEYQGGHTKTKYGYNARSIGIACQGNFEVNRMGQSQRQTLMRVILACIKAYPGIREITPHKAISPTACPGKHFPLDEACALLKNESGKEAISARMLKLEYEVTASALNMRSGAGVNNSVLKKLKKGDRLVYCGREGEWIEIFKDGRRGFVFARYVKRCDYMRGCDVAEMQAALIDAGSSPGALDGVFGEKTAAALLAFQKGKGITADGIFGPKSAAALGVAW